jgi:hypothetical protein
MSTSFEPVRGGCCRMTQQGQHNLVVSSCSWRVDWELYTEADAQQHPQFNLLQKKLTESKVNKYIL